MTNFNLQEIDKMLQKKKPVPLEDIPGYFWDLAYALDAFREKYAKDTGNMDFHILLNGYEVKNV